MSVEVYETQTYSSLTAANYGAVMKELVELVVDTTPATIYRVDAESDTAYDAILHVGENRYARMAIDGGGELTMATGYMSGEAFVATQFITGAIPDIVAAFNNAVIAINNGEVWDVRWRGGDENADARIHLRFAKLVSSLTRQPVWSGGTYSVTNDAYSAFPGADYLMIDNTEYQVECDHPSAALNNVPSGKIMLFPSLMCVAARSELGVPTIGSQRTYLIAGPRGTPLDAYTEFKINAAKFISLGAVAIRSE